MYQALRISVNYEIFNLEWLLSKDPLQNLVDGGSLIFISFHSLEDKKIMEHVSLWQKQEKAKLFTKEVIRPSATEIEENSASKSPLMRIIIND